MVQISISGEELPQDEVIKKSKFHFFKRKGASRTLPINIGREALTSNTHSILNTNEKNLSREKLLDPKDFLSYAEYVQPTNEDNTGAAISDSVQKMEEVQKKSMLNERSINSRSFKKLMHSFKGTKKFASKNKKERVSQKEGTVFNIFSSENEIDKNNYLMIDSTKKLKNSKLTTQNNLKVSKTSKNNLDNKDCDQLQTFTKKEDNIFLSENPETGREEGSGYVKLIKFRPCDYTSQSQGENAIDTKINITEKMGRNIVNIYNMIAIEKALPILDTSAIGDISEELTRKIYIILQSSLTDYSDKCINFQELLFKKEEKIKLLETNLSRVEQQLITSKSHDVFLSDKTMLKKETHNNTKIVKPAGYQTNTPPRSERSNKKNDHIYYSLKNLETKYDQLYNAYGCLENESQQVKNQSILLMFYRDKSIKFLELLYQLFEGLLHKKCLIKYQSCLKELTSNYYLYKTSIMLGSQIESTKSEIEYFFDEIATDALMKKVASKLSSLMNKTKVLEEKLHNCAEIIPSRGDEDTKLKITEQYDLSY